MPEAPSLQVRVQAVAGPLDLSVDFSLNSRWSVIFGPSGSGKSSLLRLIAGLWRPRDAEVQLGSESIGGLPPHKRRIAMVTQQPALFPHLTVRQNVAFGANSAESAWVEELIAAFGLKPLLHARPETLSGGERQRTAIARALATRPRYLLLDEVFTGMHRPQQDGYITRLKEYSNRLDLPILSVTHDVAEALSSAETVIRIEAGRIVAQGVAADVLAEEIAALRKRLTPR